MTQIDFASYDDALSQPLVQQSKNADRSPRSSGILRATITHVTTITVLISIGSEPRKEDKTSVWFNRLMSLLSVLPGAAPTLPPNIKR